MNKLVASTWLGFLAPLSVHSSRNLGNVFFRCRAPKVPSPGGACVAPGVKDNRRFPV